MERTEKIVAALKIIEDQLKDLIGKIESEILRGKAKIFLKDGCILHLKYNSFGEYGYQVSFSGVDLDRARFDNYDQNWAVTTAPHHFHPRLNQEGFESPMRADPVQDIPLLCELILSKKIKDTDIRF